LADTAAWPAVRERLARVFGVVNFALANQHALATRAGDAAAELARLGEAIVARLEGVALPSFRVRTKRSDKRFALTSPEVNAILGHMIQVATGAAVDLDAAALTVAVDILPGRAFFSLEKLPGAGGPLRAVLYRRMMLRIAEALARRAGAEALVTGDSLGQVASQTLANLAVIGEAAALPVLRPLVGMDKSEITAEAARIGTFE